MYISTVFSCRVTLVILTGSGGGEFIARPITMSSSLLCLEVWYGPGSLEKTA